MDVNTKVVILYILYLHPPSKFKIYNMTRTSSFSAADFCLFFFIFYKRSTGHFIDCKQSVLMTQKNCLRVFTASAADISLPLLPGGDALTLVSLPRSSLVNPTVYICI